MARIADTPTHAYIPGKTARHSEGCFDHIRQTALSRMTAQELAESDAFRIGLSYLSSGYFWEAHEVLEPVWMALPEESEDRIMVQALIQLANAKLKLKMDRPKAAHRLFGIVRTLLSVVHSDEVMTIRPSDILREIESL